MKILPPEQEVSSAQSTS